MVDVAAAAAPRPIPLPAVAGEERRRMEQAAERLRPVVSYRRRTRIPTNPERGAVVVALPLRPRVAAAVAAERVAGP